MPPSPAFTLRIGSSVHLEASRTTVIIAGAIAILILLLLIARVAAPVIGTALVSATLPAASLYSGRGISHGFVPPTGGLGLSSSVRAASVLDGPDPQIRSRRIALVAAGGKRIK